jgi:hypothetical protein
LVSQEPVVRSGMGIPYDELEKAGKPVGIGRRERLRDADREGGTLAEGISSG